MIFQLHSHATVFSQLKIPLPQIINTTPPLNMADGSKIINKIMPHSNKHRCIVKPGEVLLGILGEGVLPSSPTLFQTKKCHFPHPFSDQTSKIHTCFQSWPNSKGRNYVIITYIRARCNEQVISSKGKLTT